MTNQQRLFAREEFANLIMRLRSQGIDNLELFSALEKTPKHRFVDSQWDDLVYQNTILPIECGEYIERIDEQIHILSALALEKKHRVLEIGTGSGFSTAVISHLAGRVTTIERYKTLHERARSRFQALKIENITSRQMDGNRLSTNIGPFDRIIIWPALSNEPQKFLELLAGQGILIVPIGASEGEQLIVKFSKIGTRFERLEMFPVRYQPFLDNVALFL